MDVCFSHKDLKDVQLQSTLAVWMNFCAFMVFYVKTWTRLKNERHSAPVAVGGLMGRAVPWDPFGRICCVVERELLASLKPVKVC